MTRAIRSEAELAEILRRPGFKVASQIGGQKVDTNVDFDVPVRQPAERITSGGVEADTRVVPKANSHPPDPPWGSWTPNTESGAGVATGPLTPSTSRGAGAPSRKAGSGVTAPLMTPAAALTMHPLVLLCHAHGLPLPVPEFRFHPLRRWRADYCWPTHKLICEIDGGAFTEGRHTRGAGFVADMEKLNAAALLGYHVLRYTPQQLGQAIADLKVMLAREAA